MLIPVVSAVKFLLGSRLTINDEGDDEAVFRDIDALESQGCLLYTSDAADE